MKNINHKMVLFIQGIFVFSILLVGCGGSDSPFDILTDVSPVEGIQQEWTLTYEITETDCDELSVGTTEADTILVSSEDCTSSINSSYSSDAGDYNYECQAADNLVVIVEDGSLTSDDCTLDYDQTTNLEFNTETSELTGTFSSSSNTSGTCLNTETGEEESYDCNFSGTVVGVVVEANPDISDPIVDDDSDSIADDVDNCVDVTNTDQADADGDGIGDLCEADTDGDGVIDDDDNCVEHKNPEQEDIDGDGIGDACETGDELTGEVELIVTAHPSSVTAGENIDVTFDVSNNSNISDFTVDIFMRRKFIFGSIDRTYGNLGGKVFPTNYTGKLGTKLDFLDKWKNPTVPDKKFFVWTTLDAQTITAPIGETSTHDLSFTVPSDLASGDYWYRVRLKYTDPDGVETTVDSADSFEIEVN